MNRNQRYHLGQAVRGARTAQRCDEKQRENLAREIEHKDGGAARAKRRGSSLLRLNSALVVAAGGRSRAGGWSRAAAAARAASAREASCE